VSDGFELVAGSDLSVLERGEHLVERKRLYLLKHPQTKQGGAPGLPGGGKAKTDTVSVFAFATETAQRLGVADRSVRREVQIAEGLATDVRAALRGTPVSRSTRALNALARLSPSDQREIVSTVDLADSATVQEAATSRRPASRPQPRRTRRATRGGRAQWPRALVPSRPEEVTRFVFSVVIFHEFVKLVPSADP